MNRIPALIRGKVMIPLSSMGGPKRSNGGSLGALEVRECKLVVPTKTASATEQSVGYTPEVYTLRNHEISCVS